MAKKIPKTPIWRILLSIVREYAQIYKWYIIGVLSAIILYYATFTHIEVSEIGISRNFFSGHMELVPTGWHLSPPWVGISVIDTRPFRVMVSTTGRGYNAKLIQFDSSHWQDFVNTEGWRYYWLDNRLSFNLGSGFQESRGIENILRGYAYSKKPYSFLKILEEY